LERKERRRVCCDGRVGGGAQVAQKHMRLFAHVSGEHNKPREEELESISHGADVRVLDDATIWCSVASGVSWRAKKPSSQNRQYFRNTGIAIYDLSQYRCTRKSTTRAAAPSAEPKGEPADMRPKVELEPTIL
jgi:hypothetical protein